MYYNKELFVNEEIKATYNRLNKLATVLLLSILISVIVVATAIIVTLVVKFTETFMTGYAMAILGTVIFAVMFSIVLPFRKKINLLRYKQVEALKGQPIYEKYTELLKSGRKLNKITDCITFSAVAISIIAVWVLAVIFPYDFWCAYAFVFTILICDLILLTRRNKIEQIKNLETEILQELHNENENQNQNQNGDAVTGD